MDRLIRIATNEIENHGFHRAKVKLHLLEGQTEHVLCLYYMDDSRKHELAERNRQEYGVKYRYWKGDDATLKGQYSKEFLNKLRVRKETFHLKKKPSRYTKKQANRKLTENHNESLNILRKVFQSC
jgi:hypothetical protein